MRKILSLILVALFLAGCAGPPRWVWTQPEKSDEAMREDLQLCRRQAFQGAPGMPLMGPAEGGDFYEERDDLIRNCMEAMGYRQERVDAPPK